MLSMVSLVSRTTQAGVHVGLIAKKHYAVDLCREDLVSEFLNTKDPPFDYACWIDSDILMPEDSILRLVAASQQSGYSVITATVFDKKNPPAKTAPALWIETSPP